MNVSLEPSENRGTSQHSTSATFRLRDLSPWQVGCEGSPLLLDLVDRGRLLWQNVFAVDKKHPRMTRESKTVTVMIDLYCRSQHGSDRPCAECGELLVYANERLGQCPFQEGKTTCAKCPVHCFKPGYERQDQERDALFRATYASQTPDPGNKSFDGSIEESANSVLTRSGQTVGLSDLIMACASSNQGWNAQE